MGCFARFQRYRIHHPPDPRLAGPRHPLDPSSAPLRIAPSPLDPSPPGSILFTISGQPHTVPFPASVGSFFDITSSITLPEPPTSPATFEIVKTPTGTVTSTTSPSLPPPNSVQVFPDRARAAAGTRISIERPFITPSSGIFFDGIPAETLDFQLGFAATIHPSSALRDEASVTLHVPA